MSDNKRKRQDDDDDDGTDETSAEKVARLSVACPSIPELFGDIWGEVASHLPIQERLTVFGRVSRLLYSVILPLKNVNTVSCTSDTWLRLLYRDLTPLGYFPGVVSTWPQQRADEVVIATLARMFLPHSLVRFGTLSMTGLGHDHFILGAMQGYLDKYQTRIVDLSVNKNGRGFFHSPTPCDFFRRIESLMIEDGCSVTGQRYCDANWPKLEQLSLVDDGVLRLSTPGVPYQDLAQLRSLRVLYIDTAGDWGGMSKLTQLTRLGVITRFDDHQWGGAHRIFDDVMMLTQMVSLTGYFKCAYRGAHATAQRFGDCFTRLRELDFTFGYWHIRLTKEHPRPTVRMLVS